MVRTIDGHVGAVYGLSTLNDNGVFRIQFTQHDGVDKGVLTGRARGRMLLFRVDLSAQGSFKWNTPIENELWRRNGDR